MSLYSYNISKSIPRLKQRICITIAIDFHQKKTHIFLLLYREPGFLCLLQQLMKTFYDKKYRSGWLLWKIQANYAAFTGQKLTA